MNRGVEGSGHKSPRATEVSTCLWPGHLLQELSRGSECLVVLLQPHAVWKLRVHPQGEVLNDLKAAGQRQKVNNRHRQLGRL